MPSAQQLLICKVSCREAHQTKSLRRHGAQHEVNTDTQELQLELLTKGMKLHGQELPQPHQ